MSDTSEVPGIFFYKEEPVKNPRHCEQSEAVSILCARLLSEAEEMLKILLRRFRPS